MQIYEIKEKSKQEGVILNVSKWQYQLKHELRKLMSH